MPNRVLISKTTHAQSPRGFTEEEKVVQPQLSYRERQKLKGFQIEDILPQIMSYRTYLEDEDDLTNK